MKKNLEHLVEEARELVGRALAIVPRAQRVDWEASPAAVWQAGTWGAGFVAHPELDDIALDDLLWIDDQKAQIERNTQQFLAGLPANYHPDGLRLVEVSKGRLASLPDIVQRLRDEPYRFLLFCDDLSFEADDPSYKELKSALEGSVFRASGNVLIYATSNRRHLLPEYMSDNEQATYVQGELHQSEAVEEKISLSDRFGLWLSFYPFKQQAYLEVVQHWVGSLAVAHGLTETWSEEVRAEALRWALARGVRSGRTAQHFARHWVGKKLLEARA